MANMSMDWVCAAKAHSNELENGITFASFDVWWAAFVATGKEWQSDGRVSGIKDALSNREFMDEVANRCQ